MNIIIALLFTGAVVGAIVCFARKRPDDLQEAVKKAYGDDGCKNYVEKTWPNDPDPPRRRFPKRTIEGPI